MLLKFCSYQGFSSYVLTIHIVMAGGEKQGERGNHLYFSLPLTPAHKHLGIIFATLHVRWIPCIFNHIINNYQAVTWWDLPLLRTFWLFDWLLIEMLGSLVLDVFKADFFLIISHREASTIALIFEENRITGVLITQIFKR